MANSSLGTKINSNCRQSLKPDLSLKEFNLFDGKNNESYLKDIRIVSGKFHREYRDNGKNKSETAKTRNGYDEMMTNGKSCILCGVMFTTLKDQRSHFKLDWHKYNIKQRLLQRKPVKQEEFEEIVSGDLSSISGSDSDSSDDDDDLLVTLDELSEPLMNLNLMMQENEENCRTNLINKADPKVYFVNEKGIQMSLYRAVISGTKEILSIETIASRIKNLANERMWMILMTGGGHFAGAVFSGKDVIVSKTFHRYTVRAKRGTSQTMKDNKQGGHAPRSAGASLRRYNEAALVQDIQNLLHSWNEYVNKCSKIFMRVPNNYKWIFVAGKKPPFEKVLDSNQTIVDDASNQETEKSDGLDFLTQSEESKCDNKEIFVDVHEIPNNDLKDLDKSSDKEILQVSKKKKAKQGKKIKVEKEIKNNSCDNQENSKNMIHIPAIWMELYEAVNSGKKDDTLRILMTCNELYNNEMVSSKDKGNLVDEKQSFTFTNKETFNVNNNKEGNEGSNFDRSLYENERNDLLNQNFQNETVLHVASRLGETEILKILLDNGANPTVKNAKGRVPYDVATNKETRNVFRRFMAVYPEKYDYNEARIPSALTSEMEERERQKIADKKKAQSKARKQRLKEKKAEEKQRKEEEIEKEKEESEKKWFQQLSEREKRAVAAERRLGTICFSCCRSLQGLVPFERLSYKYCSTECVKQHRLIMQTAVK
ncbi:ankyrin repeat and zinc finger domain-containing protein 1-like isoform X2 [Xenia sp. Carnegie-2017]|uniref:ankyrin repeat and zinc finger domain-containing protein 1-like isoform X2 n=1 Tax=Xenia sp. Carnegie-2017 TaxID=2897299 RepID=UPI001F037DAA|nr:ankyrin repeat and zinc finger domain-containing protein 1-like isoform X2 [Xenia sp. Carnegie-2017]